jgi:hypothetical protein
MEKQKYSAHQAHYQRAYKSISDPSRHLKLLQSRLLQKGQKKSAPKGLEDCTQVSSSFQTDPQHAAYLKSAAP